MATSPVMDNGASTPDDNRLLLAEELLDVAERAMTHTRAAGSVIALKRGDTLVVRTSTGTSPEVGVVIPIADTAIGQCARSGKPFNGTPDDGTMDPALRVLGIRSLSAVPILQDREVLGVLFAVSQTPDSFSRMHGAIMMTMGTEVAGALKRFGGVVKEVPAAPLRPVAIPTPAPISTPAPATTSFAAAAVAPAPIATPVIKPVPATPPQNIVETSKKIDAAPPMKLMIDQPVLPKAAPEPKPIFTDSALAIAAKTPVLEPLPETPKPLPDLLCPGEDPRKYGMRAPVNEVSRRDRSFPVTNTYQPVKSSRPMHIPLVAAAVLIFAVAGFGMWWHGKSASAAAPASKLVAVPVSNPEPVAAAPVAEAPKPAPVASTTTKPAVTEKAEPVKTAETKSETKEAAPTTPSKPALFIAAAAPKNDSTSAVEAPMLNLASGGALPELAAIKVPAATLVAARKSTATPAFAVRTVAPVFPEVARRSGTYGEVRLQVTVSPAGKATNVHVVSGPTILRQAASAAVEKWQYRAATLDGRPVEANVDVVVKFEGPR